MAHNKGKKESSEEILYGKSYTAVSRQEGFIWLRVSDVSVHHAGKGRAEQLTQVAKEQRKRMPELAGFLFPHSPFLSKPPAFQSHTG